MTKSSYDFTIIKKIALLLLFGLAFTSSKAQVELRIVVNSGTASTTCNDFLFLPNVHWSVLTDAQEWVVYPATVSCFQSLPNLQLSKTFNCDGNVQDRVQVCFRAFDNDGTGCNVKMECGRGGRSYLVFTNRWKFKW